MDKQSVRISVDRFYYAKLSKDDGTGVTYETSDTSSGSECGRIKNKFVDRHFLCR